MKEAGITLEMSVESSLGTQKIYFGNVSEKLTWKSTNFHFGNVSKKLTWKSTNFTFECKQDNFRMAANVKSKNVHSTWCGLPHNLLLPR